MDIKFIAINDSNIERAAELKVAPNQTDMIETVEESYEEAKEVTLWRPIVIADQEQWIGFAMYGQWKSDIEKYDNRVWLDRFFIDARFQSKGYSKAVLPILLQHIKETYACHEIYLSVYDTNAVAIQIYQNLGFEFNGELDINGEKVMMLQF